MAQATRGPPATKIFRPTMTKRPAKATTRRRKCHAASNSPLPSTRRLRWLQLCGSVLEAVTHISDCLDMRWRMWITFDFGAQRGHTSIYAAIVHDDVIAPHRIQDLIA